VALSPAWVAQVQAYMASYIKWWARQFCNPQDFSKGSDG
jgi:hypothetical protein